MTKLKTIVTTTVIGLGLIGSASAQVFPGVAGTPGRGNSSPVAVMPNGGVVSNGYLAEPQDIQRGEIIADHYEGARYGVQPGPALLPW